MLRGVYILSKESRAGWGYLHRGLARLHKHTRCSTALDGGGQARGLRSDLGNVHGGKGNKRVHRDVVLLY